MTKEEKQIMPGDGRYIIVAQDAPIGREQVPLAEAIEMFQARGEHEKVQLLSRRRKDYLRPHALRCGRKVRPLHFRHHPPRARR